MDFNRETRPPFSGHLATHGAQLPFLFARTPLGQSAKLWGYSCLKIADYARSRDLVKGCSAKCEHRHSPTQEKTAEWSSYFNLAEDFQFIRNWVSLPEHTLLFPKISSLSSWQRLLDSRSFYVYFCPRTAVTPSLHSSTLEVCHLVEFYCVIA